LQKIEDNNFVKNSFEFKSTNETFVSKVIDKFNVKKATGVDKISVKFSTRLFGEIGFYNHRCIFLGNNYFQIFFLTYLLNFFLICTVPSF
jgi:hypothetical protein